MSVRRDVVTLHTVRPPLPELEGIGASGGGSGTGTIVERFVGA